VNHVSDIRLVNSLSPSILDHAIAIGTYHSKSDGRDNTLNPPTLPPFLHLFFLNIRHFGMVQIRFYTKFPQLITNIFALIISFPCTSRVMTAYSLDVGAIYNPDSNWSSPLFRLDLYPRNSLNDILDLFFIFFRSTMLYLPISLA
jgi:hypothetical protein